MRFRYGLPRTGLYTTPSAFHGPWPQSPTQLKCCVYTRPPSASRLYATPRTARSVIQRRQLCRTAPRASPTSYCVAARPAGGRCGSINPLPFRHSQETAETARAPFPRKVRKPTPTPPLPWPCSKAFARGLGPTNPCPIAVDTEPFPTSVFKALA